MEYDVLEPVRYDGKDYGLGQTISLNDRDAAPLLAAGVVAPAAQAGGAERLAVIVAALTQLDPGNAEQWLKDGRPKSDALAVYAGFPVSAAERDAAWEQARAAAGE